ncbi:ABC transporter permease [Lactonifactor longoviformis]|uniref:Ribose transport system permease protein n=1 Tax=Lactonifactor longoviformis DSM 17459 TaxID=1122155 RepID=A0A1M5BUC4_9CLOT|nr:ABC transporter permease [Lactonifactor longoviformis]POP30318.1 ABC transporter permease [Lactonifactor longoviformis]SHF46016.1 ribose transport system permease protein [Lactonifactor longoviformis DSM 17459]
MKAQLEKEKAWVGKYVNRSTVKNLSTLFALIAIWIALSIVSPYFLTISNFSNMFLQSANIMILAIGMTLILISGQIDLSLGSIEAFAGAVIAVLSVKYQLPIFAALLIALLVGTVCGFVNGFLVSRFNFPAFVATLSMQGIARGLALIITGGTSVYGFPELFKFLGQGKIGAVPFPVIIFLILLAVFGVVVKSTKFGVNLFAVGGNEEAAGLSGIDVKKTKMLVFIISGTLAALAGVIVTSRLNSGQATIGEADVMDTIASVVIGGTSLSGGIGSLRGTVVGVMITISIRNGLNIIGVSAYWQQVCIGLIIIAAILIDQFSKKER